ncbi:MlaE family ABC transporter permease [Mycolicibacterium alvei]|uniref:Putative YrbE family protein n=1 Tax=Mycolicibacterium alvei TaxID=67081 RepID=A0A6N4V1S6_9MYCO|nr:ABC transporter permease [Mycolicibacterium alvei]MCV7000091.1 ABC transporter permease [Mycolicibacterium alvei]BBX30103.1 putative YrbE family protein [Mycolicibacterium alvei]
MTAATYLPVGVRTLASALRRTVLSVRQLGHLLAFFVEAVTAIPIALRHYRREFFRLMSDVTWGNGSIVAGGGTAGVAAVLGVTAGALIGIEAYSMLDLLGLGPATGFVSSLVSTRELAPLMAALAFAMQSGCRFTAQLGAMRINEEIDALESLAIRPVPFLVTTRLLASAVAVVPLYIMCLAISYIAAQTVVGFSGGGSAGAYMHYFSMMLSGTDIVYSVIKAVVFVWIASTIQCYFGFFAAGGPEGVGVAAGHAMRAAITMVVVVNMLLTMAFWGVDAGARFGG